ncbi:MAG: ABC transporter permease [Acidobacteria bacterium]|nr:ABC transporter permease [Acidobacteriota bacterium]
MIGAIRRLFRRADLESEMREEMEFHQQARASDLVARHGLSPEEAARRARIEFGSRETYREEARAAFGFRWMDELRADARYTVRSLRRNLGFTAATLCILTLAIGVNAAFFSLYNNYAVRPLPIRGVDRHYELLGLNARAARTARWTAEEIAQLRRVAQNEVEGIYSVFGPVQVLLLAPAHRQSLLTAVSADYFPLLGGVASAGRTFTHAEEQQAVAVLSDAGWKRLFPTHPMPVGQMVRARSTWFTVIGVLPPTFTGTEAAVPDFWVPSGMRTALRDGLNDHQNASLLLRPGIAPSAAESALAAAASRFPRPSEDRVAAVRLHPRATYLSAETDDAVFVAAILFATFLLVLVIACANLANLFLARTAARAQELKMRSALGAGRSRIIRQLLTESTLLALAGAAAGLALGVLLVGRAHHWLFSIANSAGATVLPLVFDWRVFAYAALLGLLAGCAFGLMPAIDITGLQKRHPRRLRSILLGGQVAASFVLLILAAILVRNIQRLDSMNTGYPLRPTFDLQFDRTSPRLLARLRALPGVAGVSALQRVPLYGRLHRLPAQTAAQGIPVAYNYVDDHYFHTLGLALTGGRNFYPSETASMAKTAVISQGAAQSLWPNSSAIGRTLTVNVPAEEDRDLTGTYEIIGVVPDVINGWIFEGREPAVVYLPAAAGHPRMGSAIARFLDPSPSMLNAIREVCASGASATGCEPRSLFDVATMQRFPFQAAALIAGALGALALLLTAIGLYSVVSYSVEQRRREIGVLVAIGAQPRQVSARILKEAARCFAVGVAVGLPVCLALSSLAASTALKIRTFDPVAYLAVPAILAAIAALACLVPVRRALRIEPMQALRQD